MNPSESLALCPPIASPSSERDVFGYADSANVFETTTSAKSADRVVEDVLEQALYRPAYEFINRPSKHLRAQLVRAGYLLSGQVQERNPTDTMKDAACGRLAEVLEAIHTGSLIVDDIQDESRLRRGRPTLHEQYGVPLALNAGNWLYFQPFDWIRELNLSPTVELKLYRLCHQAIMKAHEGQAIDVGTRIDESSQEHVHPLCLASLRMKTGALTSLALSVGATLGRVSPSRLQAVQNFGECFGMSLQMFDDIGNFQLPSGHPKRWEDFRLRRPTWLWSVAAQRSAKSYLDFVDCVRQLPDEEPLLAWANENDFVNEARRAAQGFLDEAMTVLETELKSFDRFPHSVGILMQLAERIKTSYG